MVNVCGNLRVRSSGVTKRHISILAFLVCVLFAGCASLTGRVNTLSQIEPPHNPPFKIISPDSVSLTERIFREHIEKKMTEHGYRKASPEEVSNVAVLYKYSVGSGITSVSSSLDYVIRN